MMRRPERLIRGVVTFLVRKVTLNERTDSKQNLVQILSQGEKSGFLASSSVDKILPVGMREIEIGPPKR